MTKKTDLAKIFTKGSKVDINPVIRKKFYANPNFLFEMNSVAQAIRTVDDLRGLLDDYCIGLGLYKSITILEVNSQKDPSAYVKIALNNNRVSRQWFDLKNLILIKSSCKKSKA